MYNLKKNSRLFPGLQAIFNNSRPGMNAALMVGVICRLHVRAADRNLETVKCPK